MSIIITQSYKAPEISEKEIFRYLGCPSPDVDTRALLSECLAELRTKLIYKVCYREFNLKIDGEVCDFGAFKVSSRGLAKNLCGCKKAVLFAATIGIEIDRLIARNSRLSPAKALMLQAIGAERIEALCDRFCDDMKTEYGKLKPRFSPGYGDLPINIQKTVFSQLDCPRRVGVFLNESLIMSPSKSVTAFVGIAEGR